MTDQTELDRTNNDLSPCPCGVIPKKLLVQSTDNLDKYAMVSAVGCCDDWEMEFKNNGAIGDDSHALSVMAWNRAHRAI